MAPRSRVILPEDLIAEILSLISVKSLLRFRCVNNSWNSLILNPTFVKLHLKRSSQQNDLFTLTTHHIKYGFDESPDSSDDDLEHGYSVVPYSISRLIENPSFTHFEDPYYHLNDKGCSTMVGTCNGLILLADDSDAGRSHEYLFSLWNPATRTTSPKFGYFRDSRRERFAFSFGCDNSSNTYKVVASRYIRDQLSTEVRVLNLGENVWRNIESYPVVPVDLKSKDNYVYLNDTLNWLAIHNYFEYKIKNANNVKGISVKQFVIVSLDLGTETYNQYLLPRGINDKVLPAGPTISLLGGFLCFSYSYKKTDFVVWQMKKFGIEESWTQFLKISYQNLSPAYDYDDTWNYRLKLFPCLLSEDGYTLILRSSEVEAILYNWRDNRVKRINIIPSRTLIDDDTIDIVDWSLAKGYVESLVPTF
ncbi:F-box/kelch-repeat protein At3g23880-like [Cicer arietinum]|uniref:F-box/kelch-repeat protein At3g23880-like isoform X1 n=1 Tax=Cicer arietinum TaxID=3827 RepID=A0A1S2XQ72_CICAR|nr:F-box/kelch-repeat protein At3g23880-like isoform X1 [Cicer arietinum]XP_004492792.1 F-box/kelch-repeat protein At3g23880-like isoform X1 [Cicer arietinum]XP_012569112.1 F-box/kelch-repeat protein At3g23880-like isoform X2 [Cicer arietinum]